jgi:hypothetical protein
MIIKATRFQPLIALLIKARCSAVDVFVRVGMNHDLMILVGRASRSLASSGHCHRRQHGGSGLARVSRSLACHTRHLACVTGCHRLATVSQSS